MNENIHLEIVKQDGWNLQYIVDQTERVCIEAVRQNGALFCTLRTQVKESGWKLLSRIGFLFTILTIQP